MDEAKPIETNIVNEEKLLEERKTKVMGFLKQRWLWATVFLIIALILGTYIRSLPMQDHGGHPGLWDFAQNDWALGPDLDPWLFVRDAKEIVTTGSLPAIDHLRYVPYGFDNSIETKLLPYLIAGTYYLLTIFGYHNIVLAGAFYPVLAFALTIISFFLFVREIFNTKEKDNRSKANIIALIATFFMIVTPTFLSRTVAGIPEKESSFFLLFFSFYFFLKAWKAEKTRDSIIYGILAGVATGLMSLMWGGVTYSFITIGFGTFVAFILNKMNRRQLYVYASWVIVSFSMATLLTHKATLLGLVSSIDTGIVTITLFLAAVHFIIWESPLKNIKSLNKYKIPKNILSMIIGIVMLFVLVIIFFGPGFVPNKLNGIYKTMFNPTTGRWQVTVAENRQPFFNEWASEFGPYIKNIPNLPLCFWMFIIGSIVLFKKLLSKINNKDAWILTALYIFFLFGLIFSRYSSTGLLNGENLLSKGLFIGSSLLLVAGLLYYYIIYEKSNHKGFEEVDYSYIFLYGLFFLCLFTARSAIRLIMVLAPVAMIFVGYLIYISFESFRKSKDETMKILLGACMIIIILAGLFTFVSYYQNITAQAYSFIPSSYNFQWQKAMKWVRDDTPKTAVFAHWWDYGYWLQSIGERATVTDGGNAYVYWNYLSGRLVLTGDNQNDSLEFLYNHNATYLLIDSSDIGKYGAFSSIGSNKNYDRYSWIGTFLMDEKQTQETKNQTLLVYTGGIALDEDLNINENGVEINLPAQSTGIGIIIVPIEKQGNLTKFDQPYIYTVYNGVNHKINLRYLDIAKVGKDDFMDYGSGIEGCAYLFPSITPDNQGRVAQNSIGASMLLTPRLMRGYLAQKYILDDPFKRFPNFVVAHKEPAPVVESLSSQGMPLPDFVYYQGTQGPITIWSINYTGNEKIRTDYQDIYPDKYIDWEL